MLGKNLKTNSVQKERTKDSSHSEDTVCPDGDETNECHSAGFECPDGKDKKLGIVHVMKTLSALWKVQIIAVVMNLPFVKSPSSLR
jgi:hypothetical protein